MLGVFEEFEDLVIDVVDEFFFGVYFGMGGDR